jgi:hypothetical protein
VPLSYGLEVANIYPSYPYAHGYPLAVGDAALISGEWKIIVGSQAGLDGPHCHSSTSLCGHTKIVSTSLVYTESVWSIANGSAKP